MNIDEAKRLVKKAILKSISAEIKIEDNTELIGAEAILDSMKLVEVCLALEDLANEQGFDFDWTSGETLSKQRSMFRDVLSLSQEFKSQREKK